MWLFKCITSLEFTGIVAVSVAAVGGGDIFNFIKFFIMSSVLLLLLPPTALPPLE